ncbi:recombinase [Streptomyces sp. NBRC 110611]|uniref:hypothetical protein n=1 Tax=Streptomyces sp. NBRC 110611 TaxID=1621259 RepID=UPI000855AD08|nr:hypothetical protein [Streptomyces sp. NBRC 110611]GAU70525.1 recombinase [Streptomyces sp. NBRC 110611]
MVNPKTGKATLRDGYAPRTIAHALTVLHGFYAFHQHYGRGPVANPVPESRDRRARMADRSPLEAPVPTRRARLRPKARERQPRAIPDRLWDELFAQVGCDRDRGLVVGLPDHVVREVVTDGENRPHRPEGRQGRDLLDGGHRAPPAAVRRPWSRIRAWTSPH